MGDVLLWDRNRGMAVKAERCVMLVFEYLEKWAKERPDREAVVYADQRFTFADYEREKGLQIAAKPKVSSS